ncbi:serine-rich adhesin for platelets [Eurosta solidaginis]|uniref:serine-rich adhesin for platelets n=1 Tax=Eurosta solidaginis TaxID=178769 RepID=UPI003530AACA
MEYTTTKTTINLSNATNEANEMSTSHDEVDFVPVATTTTTTNNISNNNNNHIINSKITSTGSSNNNYNKMSENATTSCSGLNTNSNNTSKIFGSTKKHTNEHLQYQQQTQQQQQPVKQQKSVTKSKKKCSNNSNNTTTNDEPKKKSSTKDRLSLFSKLGRRISQKTLGHKDPQMSAATTETETATVTEKIPATRNTSTTNTQQQQQHANSTPPHQHKFVKSSSIARLLGNTYQQHMKKFEKQLQQQQQQQQHSMEKSKLTNLDGKFHTFGGRRRPAGPYLDRFKQYSKDDADVNANCKNAAGDVNDVESTLDFSEVLEIEANTAEELQHASSGLERFCDYNTVAAGDDEAAAELGNKTMRTLSRSLGRLWGKRLHSVEISTPDPEYKVSYLGNVLTGWAKGEGCVEKQLNTLWRNYTQNNKPDMIMRIKVCASGLKATTRQHGLTEYWANRITHCCAPKNYPRIFCWVYRHEGRKMKHELRCHAVLCSKEKMVQDICNTLKENLKRALREFKREKILKQNARLSLANAAYENPSLPRRKILLIVGGNNYRPPLERSKSAPKLMAIEEAIGEEEGEDAEETNEPEMKSCCQKDSLYPAMTLGRRRCRRGHSIRRTGKARPLGSISLDESRQRKQGLALAMSAADTCCHNKLTTKESNSKQLVASPCLEAAEEQRHSYGSDESDDFEKLLKYNDYDTNTSLTTELLPYFDMQLHKNTSSSLSDLSELKHDEEEPLSLPPTINTNPMAHPEGDMLPNDHAVRAEEEGGAHDETHVSLRRDGVCSDGEEDFLDAEDLYFRQASILNILHRNSMRKMAQIALSSDEGGSSIDTNSATPLQYRHQTQSSISSNASSNATTSSSINDGHIGLTPSKRHSGGDSDEGSISSGCETASTVTANQDDLSLQYRHNKQLLQLQESALFDADDASRFFNMPVNEHATATVTVDEIYQRLEARLQRRQNSDATTFSSSSTTTLKMSSESSLADSTNDAVQSAPTIEDTINIVNGTNSTTTRVHRQRQRQLSASIVAPPQRNYNANDTDSECSDESGYVEFREEREKTVREKVCDVERRELAQQQQQEHHHVAHQRSIQKPQVPPKPMPRRTLSGGGGGAIGNGMIVFCSQQSSNSTAV